MAKILVTHGLPAEGFDLLAGHEVVLPPPLQAMSGTSCSRKSRTRTR